MDRPDAAVVREISKVDFPARGYADDTELQVVVDQATAYIEQVTGRSYAAMPAALVPIALQVTRMRTEQLVFQSLEEYVETITDDAVQSFSAGPYSETRVSADRKQNRPPINDWPALNEMLWLLLGLMPGEVNDLVDLQREYWLALFGGAHAPAWGVTEVDWASGGSYGADWLGNGPVNPGLERSPYD